MNTKLEIIITCLKT